MNEPFKANYEKENSFIFPKITEDKEKKIEAATKKVERAAESFARALDSTSP